MPPRLWVGQDWAAAGSRSGVAAHPPLAPGVYSRAKRARAGAGGEEGGNDRGRGRERERTREREDERDNFIRTHWRAWLHKLQQARIANSHAEAARLKALLYYYTTILRYYYIHTHTYTYRALSSDTLMKSSL